MIIKFLILFLYISTLCYSQNKVLIQCVDRRDNKKLSSKEIKTAEVILTKYNGRLVNLGPVINGQFEIEEPCHRGDQFSIVIDQGEYITKTWSCIEITKKFKNKFPLSSLSSTLVLFNNLKQLVDTTYENKKAQLVATAFFSNTLAYIRYKSDTAQYNYASELTYNSLGEIFNVEAPTMFDSTQGLWVPTPGLENAIISYKEKHLLKNNNGKVDFILMKKLSGLSPMDEYKSQLKVYEIVLKLGIF